MPTQTTCSRTSNTLSNWGRWGDDDDSALLNHITDTSGWRGEGRAPRQKRVVRGEIAVPGEMDGRRRRARAPPTCLVPRHASGFRNDRRWGFSNEWLGIPLPRHTINPHRLAVPHLLEA